MILRERCDIWENVAKVATAVPCEMQPVSSTEKEVRGTQAEQTYLFITKDRTIPFAAGAEFYVIWAGQVWNVKGNLADVKVRGRLHHREGIIKFVRPGNSP